LGGVTPKFHDKKAEKNGNESIFLGCYRVITFTLTVSVLDLAINNKTLFVMGGSIPPTPLT
jgi:hypothetical protein